MAELEDRLTALMSTLLQSRMAPLGLQALERLNEAEAGRPGVGAADGDPFAPSADETQDRRAARHLDLIDAAIAGQLKQELSLMERCLELARELSSRLRSEGPEAFATVLVVDDADRATVDETGLLGTDLLTGARRERLEAFLAAWRMAVSRLRDGMAGGLG